MSNQEENFSLESISLFKGIQKMFLSAFLLIVVSGLVIYAALPPIAIAAIILAIVAL